MKEMVVDVTAPSNPVTAKLTSLGAPHVGLGEVPSGIAPVPVPGNVWDIVGMEKSAATEIANKNLYSIGLIEGVGIVRFSRMIVGKA
ncbi:MAG: hypothetical protein KF762_17125 [Acidobacteria bacterium]|nr:hypothetical protein [Acidobacteriota bacterium]